MSSYVGFLPPEILANVFEYHADDRKQIGSCRLVSKRFKLLSSPFLITKLVFAKRMRDIAKAMELASHTYFSYFITEIVYDLSYWQSLEYGEYIDECNEVERLGLRHFCDAEWYRHTLAEDLFHSSLYKGPASRPPNSASTFLARTTDGMNNQLLKSHDDGALTSVRAKRKLGDHDLNRMGCHLSFPRYQRHEEFHEAFTSRGRYLDTLIEIAAQLPKLRAVRFTDYRGLAGDFETYSELSTCVFSNVLEPERWDWNLPGNQLCTAEAMWATEAISGATGGLRSVSYGPHGYEMFHYSDEPLVTYKEPHYLSIEELDPLEAQWSEDTVRSPLSFDWKQTFGNLRSARLSFLIPEPSRSLKVAKALTNALPSTIRSLAMCVQGPVEGLLAQQSMTLQMIQPFDELVFPYRFPHLRILELEGWCVELTALEEFLRAHASTLQQLHLINMQCSASNGPDEEQDLATFAAFVAKELHLTGVEIIEVDMYGPVEIPSNPNSTEKWLIPDEPSFSEWNKSDFVKCIPDYNVENACLGGRANVIHRRRLPTKEGQRNGDFGSMPAHW